MWFGIFIISFLDQTTQITLLELHAYHRVACAHIEPISVITYQ